jgi:hypothetical protein
MAPRHERAVEIAHKIAVLAASLPTVTCLTGFAADIQTGLTPFVMPPLTLLTNDAPPILITSEDDALAGSALGNVVVSVRKHLIYPHHTGHGLGTASTRSCIASARCSLIKYLPVELSRPSFLG